jgi:hypothetical protein
MSQETKKDDAIWADGLRIFKLEEGQGRSWGVADIKITPAEFITWLKAQPLQKDGTVKIALNKSERTGNWYTQLDTFVPKKKQEEAPAPEETEEEAPAPEETEEDAPF